MPNELTLREIKYTIVKKGKRPKEIILVTTLLDVEVFTKEELADLYNIRRRAQIDLGSLKTVMEMDVLRCKTSEMVRREVRRQEMRSRKYRKDGVNRSFSSRQG